MPRADEFCTRDPHHEGAEIFGSQKRELDTPIGVDEETYRSNTINFSWPRLGKRSLGLVQQSYQLYWRNSRLLQKKSNLGHVQESIFVTSLPS